MASGQEIVVTEDHSRRSSDELRILINQDQCRGCHTRSGCDNDWLRSLQSEKHAATTPRNKPKIQKVPERRREVTDKRYYDPLVVSIGPIHHGRPHLQAMEKFKRQLARMYADACHKKKGIDIYQLYDKVEEVAESGRSCYADGLTAEYDRKAFVHMMLLDGCFVLQYIHSTVVGNPAELEMKSHDLTYVRGDLLLLENQLPFEVLRVIMSCRFNGDEGMEMIDRFFKRLRPDPSTKKKKHGLIKWMKNLFLQLCFPYTAAPKQAPNPLPTSAAHLLELLRGRLIKCGGGHGGGGDDEWFSYRSVTELKKVGIKFCPGRERCFSNIRFKSSFHQSRLILPPVTIDDCSKSLFLNLVAYEACPDTPDDFGVSSYLCFMDSLIDDAEDVKELRSRGVLFNLMGSDHDVAELFNEISRDLVPNPDAYVAVKQKIQKHYKNKGRVWITEWKNTHFSSPWTVLAFLAAIFVIAMDLFQTVLTYIQTFKQDPPNPCCKPS